MATKSAMNFRTTYILIGAASLLLAGLAVYVFFGEEKKSNPQGYLLETFHSLEVTPDQITGLEIEKSGEKMVFARQSDGRWRIVQPLEARADSNLIEAVVRQILIARKVEKGVDVTPNLSVHGLDNPPVKITLRKGDRTATLNLGKVTIGGDQAVVFVTSSDQPKKPQATRKQYLSALFKESPSDDSDSAAMVRDVDEFRSKRLLGEFIELSGAENQLHGIKLSMGRKVIAISRDNPDKVWRFVSPAGYGDVEMNRPPDSQLNEAVIQSLPQLIKTCLAMEVPDVKDYLTEARDLSTLGLDPSSPGVLRIDFERQDAVGTETLWISAANAKKERDKVYVRYEGDASVAQINGEKARMLRRFIDDPTNLRETTLVKLRPERVDAIDVTQDKKTFSLRKVDVKKWKVWSEEGKEADASEEAIELLIHRLSEPRQVKGFPADDAKDAALGLDNPKAEIKIWVDGIVKQEKADANTKPAVKPAPTAVIAFGKSDVGGVVFARRTMGANTTFVKVPEMLLSLAEQKRLDYMNISLTPFDPAKVEKIMFPKGNDDYEIERVDPAKPFESSQWKIVAPESKKNKFANAEKIRVLLTSLAQMKPQKVVAEKPSSDQLLTSGFDPSKRFLKITLKIKDEKPDRIYSFGNPVAAGLKVYARTNASDYLFEAPLAIVDIATKGELVDPMLYQVDPALVKVLKLKGWIESSTKDQPQSLELEQTSGVWLVKGGGAVDSHKVNTFLNLIARPKSETTVIEKKGAQPEHGLDVNKGALEIEMDLVDGKKVTLTLGALADKNNNTLYASTDQLKGDVFTIKGDDLITFKEKPGAFKK